jgi:hypothetical protein
LTLHGHRSTAATSCHFWRWAAKVEIDVVGTVFVDDSLPIGEFANITVGDWRGYDLVAAR